MNKQTPNLIAAIFIRECLDNGLSPFEVSRKTSFSNPALTNRVRHIIKKWEDRRSYVDALDDVSRKSRERFIAGLPMISGLGVERAMVGTPARSGYRLYCPKTLYVLLDIQDKDIPDEYSHSEDSRTRYAAFWSMVA